MAEPNETLNTSILHPLPTSVKQGANRHEERDADASLHRDVMAAQLYGCRGSAAIFEAATCEILVLESSSPPRVACWFDHVALLPLGPDRRSCQIGRDSSVTQERLKRERRKWPAKRVVRTCPCNCEPLNGQRVMVKKKKSPTVEVLSYFDREGCFKLQQASVARRVPLWFQTPRTYENMDGFPIRLVLFFLGAIDCVSRTLLAPGTVSCRYCGMVAKKKNVNYLRSLRL